jgi:O-antigen/teichoic acid export membrane protein
MKKEGLMQQVLKSSIWNLLFMIVGRLGGLIFVVLLTRTLLPERFGLYNLAFSIAMIFFSLADLGINKGAMTYISIALKTKNYDKVSTYYHYILNLKMIISLILSLILIFLSYPISNLIFHKPELALPLILFGIYIFILSLVSFFESLFFIIQKISYLNIKEAVFQASRILLAFLFFSIVASTYYILSSIIALIISSVLALGVLYFYIRRLAPNLFSATKKVDLDKKRLGRFLIYASIGNISGMLFGYIDNIILGIFLPAQYIGFYSSAFVIISSLVGFLSVSSILLPIFSQMNKNKISQAFNQFFKYACIFVIPAILGLIILGKYFIRTLYGYEYLPAAIPLLIMSVLILEMVYSNSLSSLLLSREKTKEIAIILVQSIILNIILNVVLVYTLLLVSNEAAMAGAAIAFVIGRYFYSTKMTICSNKELKIKINFKYLIKPIISSIIMTIILCLIITNVKDMTLVGGLICLVIGVIVYFITMFIIKGITMKDIEIVKELKNSFLKKT